MLLNINWLKDFVPYEGSAEELGASLTMLGLELEGIEKTFGNLSALRIGKVISCIAHPESDHLSITKVDIGEQELLPIVCGAPNVAEGQLVPIAPVGTTMPNGLLIKAAELRGQASHGMICSEKELGLSEDHEGIMVLNELLDDTYIGKSFTESLGLDAEVLDISITPNRGDCLSVLGLAREIALIKNLPLSLPKSGLQTSADNLPTWHIDIPNAGLCSAYHARFINDITVKKAPLFIRQRLISAGIRPISNIVDITNYILIECGQPLHAFDRNLLPLQSIEVSVAKEGETLTTLDGQERKLLGTDLLIRDAQKRPVGLAGVMGGLNSEVTDSTTNILLESAVFDAGTIRKTARRLGLSSEASSRFERGIDPYISLYAADRAAALMAEFGGGTVSAQLASTVTQEWSANKIPFRLSYANSLLGMDIDEDFAKKTFAGLGCELENDAQEEWTVKSPSWRHDLSREVDLIEELARVKGMDNLPESLPAISKNIDQFGQAIHRPAFISQIKHWAAGLGLNEAISFSFVGDGDLDHLDLPKEDRINIINPLSEEQNVLRTHLAPSLLLALKHNIAHGNNHLRLFEVASTFHKDESKETQTKEIMRLGLIMHGNNDDQAWQSANRQADYTDIRGLCEHLFANLQIKAHFTPCKEHPFLAPAVHVEHNGQTIGIIGRIMPAKAERMHAREAVWFAQIDIDPLHEHTKASRTKFVSLPVFPPSRRDITLVAPRNLSIATLLEAISNSGEALLEECHLQDVYEPEKSEEKNLTFRLTYRHQTRTLKDKEVDKAHEQIYKKLVELFAVRLQG